MNPKLQASGSPLLDQTMPITRRQHKAWRPRCHRCLLSSLIRCKHSCVFYSLKCIWLWLLDNTLMLCSLLFLICWRERLYNTRPPSRTLPSRTMLLQTWNKTSCQALMQASINETSPSLYHLTCQPQKDFSIQVMFLEYILFARKGDVREFLLEFS